MYLSNKKKKNQKKKKTKKKSRRKQTCGPNQHNSQKDCADACSKEERMENQRFIYWMKRQHYYQENCTMTHPRSEIKKNVPTG